jgi:hypothetical protein
MKQRASWIIVVALSFVLLAAGGAFAGGKGPAQLTRAGWLCVNAGPDDYVHCFPPGAFRADASVAVRVFETTDTGAESAHYLGTELLIRDDLYAGQPCAQNDGEYELLPASETGLPADYRACHHYATEH